MRVLLARPNGTWLDPDAPASAISYTEKLSSPGSVDVTLPIEFAERVGEDGRPVLAEHGTIVAIEGANRRIVAYGLVDTVMPEGDAVRVAAGGVSMTSKDLPWGGVDQSWTSRDALDGWRTVWAHIQMHADAQPVTIEGDEECGVRVGRPESALYRTVRLQMEEAERVLAGAEKSLVQAEADMLAWKKNLYAIAKQKKVGEVKTGESAPSSGSGAPAASYARVNASGTVTAVYFWLYRDAQSQWILFDNVQVRNRAQGYLNAVEARDAADDLVKDRESYISGRETYIREVLPESHPEPYTLTWHANRDLQSNLTELSELGGFDWIETARWDDATDTVVPFIEARKRIGARREHILFELGTNVHTEPVMAARPYFSEVHVFGTGEGSDTLHADEATSDYRVRRVRHVTNKDARTRQLVDAALTREARTLGASGLAVEELTVTDDDSAPFGTFGLGDEVRVKGVLASGQRLDRWIRITAITHDGSTDDMALEVQEV